MITHILQLHYSEWEEGGGGDDGGVQVLSSMKRKGGDVGVSTGRYCISVTHDIYTSSTSTYLSVYLFGI